MTTPEYDINKIMQRVKSLKPFTVEMSVDQTMAFSGKFPFDTMIKDGKAYFKVYAATHEEADSQVQKFLAEK